VSVRASRASIASSAPAIWALVVLVGLEFAGAYGVWESRVPVSPFTSMFALAGAVAVWRMTRQAVLRHLPRGAVVAMMAYVVGLAIAAAFSPLPATVGAEAVMQGLKDLAYFLVLLCLAVGQRSWRPLAVAIAAPPAVIGYLCAASVFVLGPSATFGGFATVTQSLGVGTTLARMAGPVEDSNFWGRFLVVALPFALALLLDTARASRRVLWSLAVLGILLGVYLTGSRGTFFAVAAAVLVFLVSVGLTPLRVLAGALVTAPLTLLVPGVGSRLFSILGLAAQGQRIAVDPSILSRIATQEVGLAMVRARPLTGVGAGGYFAAFPDYAATTEQQLQAVVAPHNVYLGILAETGAVGLATWLSLLVVCLVAARGALHLAGRLPDAEGRTYRLYAAALLSSIVGWMVSSVFLHLAYFRVLLIPLALAACLQGTVTAIAAAHRPDALAPSPPARIPVRTVTGVALGSLLGLLGAAALPQHAEGQVVGHLVPVVNNSYLVNLRTRTSLLPTYAVVIGASDDHVDSQGDPSSGAITITTVDPDVGTASRRLHSVTSVGDAAIASVGMDRLWRVSWAPPVVRTVGPSSTKRLAGAALGAVLGGLAGARIRRRNRTGPDPQPGRMKREHA